MLKSGVRYYIVDSDPETWSYNVKSENCGFVEVRGQVNTNTPALASGITVTINGTAVQWTDVQPFINSDNRTMVPLRAVGEALGLSVSWDGTAREAIFSNGTKTIYFPINSKYYRTEGGGYGSMDTAAVIVNDRTFAPIRYLAEYFGYTVGWDGNTRTVLITGGGYWELIKTVHEVNDNVHNAPGYSFNYDYKDTDDGGKYVIECTFVDNGGEMTAHYIAVGECTEAPGAVMPDQPFYMSMKVYAAAASGWLEPYGGLGMDYIHYHSLHYASTFGFVNVVEDQPASFNSKDGGHNWTVYATFPEGVPGETIDIACWFHQGDRHPVRTTWTYAWHA